MTDTADTPAGGTFESAVAFLRDRVDRAPSAVVVLGSGLSGVASEIDDPISVPYAEVPGFPRATVAGHAGALLFGRWGGVEVVAMRGRFHLYEGWPAKAVVLPLRALRALGASQLVVTNAAGALRSGLEPGDLMLIADHIDMMFRNPLSGAPGAGEARFPDMSDPYDSAARDLALRAASEMRIALSTGVYAAVLGPSFETPAEIAMLRLLGADAVGMSTAPEVIAARAFGMRVLGISCITNGLASAGSHKLTHEEVLQVAGDASVRLTRLLRVVLPRMIAARTDP